MNYESLLLYLGTDKLIKVFSSMLMERRLILCSKSLRSVLHYSKLARGHVQKFELQKKKKKERAFTGMVISISFVCMMMMMAMADSSWTRIWEGLGSVLVCLLVSLSHGIKSLYIQLM